MPEYFSQTSRRLSRSLRKRWTALLRLWEALSGRSQVPPAGEERPTRIVFVIHMPALWSKLEPLYREALAATDFHVFVIAAHRDPNVSRETACFLAARGIAVVGGANSPSANLESLKPDYVFHSVPYDYFYPDHLQAREVWRYARLCYVPYVGQLIYASKVADITHHAGYFELVRLVFLADVWEKDRLLEHHQGPGLRKRIKVVGSPHAEEIAGSFKRPADKLSQPPSVLWTPRWNTDEGNCHFFDYKDFLLEMSGCGQIALTFRPHPLCLPHLLKTGELTREEHDRYLARLEHCQLARLDLDGDYLKSLEGHEIFVSDMSSVLADAFLTGKPVIYTHRVDHFNVLGRFMSGGFYWVRTKDELAERLLSLAAGNDPLKDRRTELLAAFKRDHPEGSVGRILEHIRQDRVCN